MAEVAWPTMTGSQDYGCLNYRYCRFLFVPPELAGDVRLQDDRIILLPALATRSTDRSQTFSNLSLLLLPLRPSVLPLPDL